MGARRRQYGAQRSPGDVLEEARPGALTVGKVLTCKVRKGSPVIDVLSIVLGIGLLYGGGELLVRFASSLALRFRLSPLVIGLTVVAFGTSAPELAATLTASLNGAEAIAVGNVVGSNIANVGLILGLAALLLPIAIQKSVLQREMPVMIGASVLPLLFFADGALGRLEGGVLFALLLAYLVWMLRTPNEDDAPDDLDLYPLWLTLTGIVGGLVLLVLGAQVLIAGATSLALAFGVPERIVGLTLVAVGTSLPELASSLVAVLKRETDMVLGNIIGSNIFNVLCILGVTSLVTPLALPFAALRLDFLVMLAFAVLTFIFLLTQRKLERWEGGVLVLAYALYAAWLF